MIQFDEHIFQMGGKKPPTSLVTTGFIDPTGWLGMGFLKHRHGVGEFCSTVNLKGTRDPRDPTVYPQEIAGLIKGNQWAS